MPRTSHNIDTVLHLPGYHPSKYSARMTPSYHQRYVVKLHTPRPSTLDCASPGKESASCSTENLHNSIACTLCIFRLCASFNRMCRLSAKYPLNFRTNFIPSHSGACQQWASSLPWRRTHRLSHLTVTDTCQTIKEKGVLQQVSCPLRHNDIRRSWLLIRSAPRKDTMQDQFPSVFAPNKRRLYLLSATVVCFVNSSATSDLGSESFNKKKFFNMNELFAAVSRTYYLPM